MQKKKKIRHPILQTWGSRCQGSERITPALTFTTAVAFHPRKRDDVYASLLFWVLGGLFRKPAQLSFDLSSFLAPVSPSAATHCRIALIFLLAVLHLAKEFAAACEPLCVMSDFHTREWVSVKHIQLESFARQLLCSRRQLSVFLFPSLLSNLTPSYSHPFHHYDWYIAELEEILRHAHQIFKLKLKFLINLHTEKEMQFLSTFLVLKKKAWKW